MRVRALTAPLGTAPIGTAPIGTALAGIALAGVILVAASNPMLAAARGGSNAFEPPRASAGRQAYVALERVIEASALGLVSPDGITFARESGELLVTGTRSDGTAGVQSLSLVETLAASVALPAGLPAGADVAYDSTRDHIVAGLGADSIVAAPAAGGRVAPDADAAASVLDGGVSTGPIAGVEVNPAGETLVLDPDGTVRITRAAAPAIATSNRVVTLSGADEALHGLAIGPDGHLFSLGMASGALYEFDAQGAAVASRDLASLGVDAPRDLTIAPSGDTNDAATDVSMYVADAAGVAELALVETALSPQVEAAALVSSVSHIKTINTGAGSVWNPDSPDPSGLAYIPAGEPGGAGRADRLVSGDGEVEENTGAGWHNVNVWFAPRSGAAQTATFNTTVAPTSPANKEPVGVAYDPVRNELYICKDGADGVVWVYSVATMAQVRSFTVSGAPYNNIDPEGLAFGGGALYMVDAIDNDLVKVLPGGNGIVGSGNDDQVSSYDLEQYGQREPEGLDVHPDTGNVWIVSNRVASGVPEPMIEVTPTGALVSSVSIAAANPNSAGGLAIAPPSAGGSGYSIYIADRGLDNSENPNENDGKIYEFSLSGGGPTPPVANFSTAQTPGTLTVNFTDTSAGSPTSWSWDFGNGGSTVDSTAQNPSFTYAAPGPYQVTLTATNDEGSDPETKTVTVTDPSAAPNLLLNPSFELDTNGNTIPDDWGTNAKFTRSSATAAQDGAFVGRHLNNNAVIFQQVNVSAGTSYDFSGMVNLPATSDAFSFQLNVRWRSASGNIGSPVVIHNFTDDTNGAWQTRSATLIAPAGATGARIQMDGNSMNATGTAYVDGFSFKVAGPPPPPVLDTTITGGPSGSTTATDATFTFTGSGPAASFECRLDSPTWTACSSPQVYPGPLGLGPHTFDVRALDASSNPDPTPASRSWTIVDSPPPVSNLLLNPSFELDTNGNTIPDDWGTNAKFTRSSAIAAPDGSFVGRQQNNNGKSFQQVGVTAGTSYAFSGMVNLPDTTDAFEFELNVEWRAGSTVLSKQVIHAFVGDTDGAWMTRTATLVAPAGATSARVQMEGEGMGATTIGYVDLFSFGATP